MPFSALNEVKASQTSPAESIIYAWGESSNYSEPAGYVYNEGNDFIAYANYNTVNAPFISSYIRSDSSVGITSYSLLFYSFKFTTQEITTTDNYVTIPVNISSYIYLSATGGQGDRAGSGFSQATVLIGDERSTFNIYYPISTHTITNSVEYSSITPAGIQYSQSVTTNTNGINQINTKNIAGNSAGYVAEIVDSILIQPNVEYKILLRTYTTAQIGGAYAYADPYIEIDPSFGNASSYQLVLSNGVGNAPLNPNPVPIPSTGLLFGSCIAGLTAVGRRRRT